VNLCRAHHIGYGHCLPQRASGHAEQQDDGAACQVPERATAAGGLRRSRSGPATSDWVNVHEGDRPGAKPHQGFIAGRPACVERSIPSDPDRRSVVPQTGDDSKNGRSRCRRQPSPGTCAPGKSPSSSTCHQRRSAAGRRRACCPTSVPWAATDATPTRRSGPCWKPCPSPPRPASRAPRLTALAPLLSVAWWPFGSSSARSGGLEPGAQPTSSVRETIRVIGRPGRRLGNGC
jgi:hypothetical protein